MKAKETYLKGKSVFTVSVIVIVVTALTVWLTGTEFNRSITTNFYISLSIIGTCLLAFLTYGLYFGVGLIDNFPEFKNYQRGEFIAEVGDLSGIDVPDIDGGDDFAGLFAAILFWIAVTFAFVFLLIILDALLWISLFIIAAMLYWVFFRALKLVFSKSHETKGILGKSVVYAFGYTFLYLGWIYGIVYLVEIIK